MTIRAHNSNNPVGTDCRPLEMSLQLLDALGEAGIALVPGTPTPAMLRAGAEAGDISETQALRIYQAMISTDE